MRRIKGARDLVFDGVEIVTNLVQRTHVRTARRWERLLGAVEPVGSVARGVNEVHLATSAITYATIRTVNRGVQKLVDLGTDPLLDDSEPPSGTPMTAEAQGSLPWWIDHAEGALNGFFGDHLADRDNGLDVGMSLRREGQPVALDHQSLAAAYPAATNKVCVFVHGLSATEWSWVIFADRLWGDPTACFGAKLERDLGYTPLYLRYNSGRHVSDNGRRLAELLDELVKAYPVAIDELVIVGHSMGGLVARSAVHYAHLDAFAWVKKLRQVLCIGAPHFGAPLEKGTNLLSALLRAIPAAGAEVPAAVLDARSAGIKDLRWGYTLEEEWRDQDPNALFDDQRRDMGLVDGVRYAFVAATITRDADHPLGQLVGDLLVRLPSATGRATDPERHIPFQSGRVFQGMSHLALANHPAVYEVLREILADGGADES